MEPVTARRGKAHHGESTLVGRATQLAELRRALQAACVGTGSCVVVEGPAGIGKRRLLAAARDIAGDIGLAVTMGRAGELDRSAPLSTLVTTLRNNPALSPQVDALGPGSGPVWLVHRIGELIATYAKSQPLVIAIDDAHWADELTAFALRMLIGTLQRAPVVWMLARRHGLACRPSQDTIDHLIAEGATCLPLGPLDGRSIAQMCEQLLGAAPDDSLLEEVARGGGNPFLVEQLVRGLRGSGQVTIADGAAKLTGAQLPATFLDAVGGRLRDLPAHARRMLEAGSVLGRPFSVHEAAHLAGLPVTELVQAVTAAVQAGALIDSGARLVFSHDLIREAIYAAMLSSVREALHREAAAVVEEEGGTPLEVAEHLIRGRRVDDEQGIAILHRAVNDLVSSAPSTAADLVLRILDLIDKQSQARPDLTATAVRLLARAGRIAEARSLAEQALRTETGAQEHAQLMLGLAEALKHGGQNKLAISYATSALTRPAVPEDIRAQLLAIQAHALLRTDGFALAKATAMEALESGEKVGNREALVFANTARSCVELSGGNLTNALKYAREAVNIADADGGEALHWHPRLWLAVALMVTDSFTEAAGVLGADRQAAERLGTAWSEPLWYYCRAQLSMAEGHLADALAEAKVGVRVAEHSGALALHAPLLALLGHICLHLHDIPAARRYIAQARSDIRNGISVGPEDLAWRIAVVDDAEGHPGAAFRTLADLYALLPARLHLFAEDPAAAAKLVRIARQVGQHSCAEQVAAAARSLSNQNPGVASLRGAAAHASGVLLDDVGALREAVQAFRNSPRPLALAAAVEDAAIAEGTRGDHRRVVKLLEEAAEIYTTCGAARDASRVAQELARHGSRRKSRGLKKTADQWAGLSESELRVVRLVAEGLTNRQVADRLFLSPHTIDSHLRHSFGKLGVNSRVELTRLVMAHEADRQKIT